MWPGGFDTYFDNYEALTPDTSQFVAMLAETKGERIVQEAIQWMKSTSPKPFFAWIHLYEPHDPYEPPEPYKSRYSQHPYDGEIAYTDANLEKLFQYLKSSNLYEKTWIFLAGDHGEGLGEHQEAYHGYFIYDASLHVPLIIKGLTPETKGRRVPAQVRIVDIPSTIMAVVQGSSPGFQGRELLSMARDPARAPALPAYSESYLPKVQFGWSELKSWRFGRYKYIEAPRPELYDIEKDPRETMNLLATQQAVANQYRQELARFYPLYQRSANNAVTQSKLSPAELQQLQSLGYVGGS
ncbi:MAG TPA: sulfatase-like hydrolase/transferase, partial [Terriglobia bacterium]|nr:sulfatase-like hydrolase/transferase [Terriglobia bacterium]